MRASDFLVVGPAAGANMENGPDIKGVDWVRKMIDGLFRGTDTGDTPLSPHQADLQSYLAKMLSGQVRVVLMADRATNGGALESAYELAKWLVDALGELRERVTLVLLDVNNSAESASPNDLAQFDHVLPDLKPDDKERISILIKQLIGQRSDDLERIGDQRAEKARHDRTEAYTRRFFNEGLGNPPTGTFELMTADDLELLLEPQPRPICSIHPFKDWLVDRKPDHLAEELGIKDLSAFVSAISAFVYAGNPAYQGVNLCMGPGNGDILRYFRKAVPHMKHLGFAHSFVHTPASLLNAALAENTAESDNEGTFTSFHQILGNLLIDAESDRNRLYIRIGDHSDEEWLKRQLVALATHSTIQEIANGTMKRVKMARSQEDDSRRDITESDRELAKKFCEDPIQFFREYYDEAMGLSSKGSLIDRLELSELSMIYGRFEDLDGILPASQFICTYNANRSTSHLGDWQYARAIRDVARRMLPGATILDEGARESYAHYFRINELRKAGEQLGPDFQFYIIGNKVGPRSITALRRRSDGQFATGLMSGLCRDAFHLVALEDYERRWPKHAVINRAIREIKVAACTEAKRKIANGARVDEVYEDMIGHPLFANIRPRMNAKLREAARPNKPSDQKLNAFLLGLFEMDSQVGDSLSRRRTSSIQSLVDQMVCKHLTKHSPALLAHSA